MKRGRTLTASAVFVVLFAACAPPPKTIAVINSPTPSPSPTPTAPVAATAPTFHIGEVGVAYGAVAFSATGGVAPYKYAVQSGALPGGLNLGADGSISGTPTAGGNYAFTIAISDSGDSTTTVDGKISIANALTAHLIPACSSYCNAELGCTTACGSFGTLTGGVGPFSFSLLSGQLPAGTSLNGFTLNGTFTGQSGWLQFTVQASDALGAVATLSPKFWMWTHIAWSGTYHCNGNYLTACQVQIAYSGGLPGGQPQLTLASVGAYCPPNFTTCPPAPANAPTGISTSVTPIGSNGGGSVTFTVAADCGGASAGGCPNGYYGAIGLVLVDQALCAPNTRCQTGVAIVDVYMQAG